MSHVIALQGVKSMKEVDGQTMEVVPFVGADREGECAQLGIGFQSTDGRMGAVWGLVMPHTLIQSWRGMKILERLPHINHGTLCACWTVATHDLHPSEERHLIELAEQLGGGEKLQTLLDEVLALVPTVDELNSMITILREKKVDIDCGELKEEMEAGRITTSPLIDTLFHEEEEQRRQYEREQEEINKPVPQEESLGVFFRALDIGNFIVGGGIGGYGMDWGHIELKDLDRIAKQDSFSKYSPEGHRLEHTTEGPETLSARLTPGVTVHLTSFGEIEQPWFQTLDGTRYTFMFARFSEGHFLVKVKIEKDGVPPTEGEYPVSQLRAMIEPFLPKKVPNLLTRLFHCNRK